MIVKKIIRQKMILNIMKTYRNELLDVLPTFNPTMMRDFTIKWDRLLPHASAMRGKDDWFILGVMAKMVIAERSLKAYHKRAMDILDERGWKYEI